MVNDSNRKLIFAFVRRVDPPHRSVEVCCLADCAVSFFGVHKDGKESRSSRGLRSPNSE
jgi:hypothetical protein